MRFSIVIPTYNRAHFLPRTLQSVWAQRCADYEVIIVDDGSSDGTQEFLDGLPSKVRVICQTNRGPGAARNAGAREAKGDYVAFLDSDDLWFPWTLATFARAIEEHRNPSIVGGRFVEFADETALPDVREEAYDSSYFADYFASSYHPYFVGSGTCVVRRDALAATNFLEDRLNAEDHDLMLQMGTRPGFVRILAPATLAWRRHPESETENFASGVSGALRLLAREKSGAYPGGRERLRERRRIITRHIRPTTVACLRKRKLKQAWNLYRSTFSWHVGLGNCKYIFGFPILAALALVNGAVNLQRHRA